MNPAATAVALLAQRAMDNPVSPAEAIQKPIVCAVWPGDPLGFKVLRGDFAQLGEGDVLDETGVLICRSSIEAEGLRRWLRRQKH